MFVLLLFIACAFPAAFANAGEEKNNPGDLPATAIYRFCHYTVAPYDPDELAVKIFKTLSKNLDELYLQNVNGRWLLTDDRNPDLQASIHGALLRKENKLKNLLEKILNARPETDVPALVTGPLSSCLREVDPYAKVIKHTSYRATIRQLEGRMVGVGVSVHKVDEGIRIQRVVPDSPAFEAGLRQGDRITAIDGQPLAGLTAHEIHNLFRGPAGSKVKVMVYRTGSIPWQAVLVRRDLVYPVVHFQPQAKHIYSARIDRFAASAPVELKAGLKRHVPRLRRSGGLILDLRGNAGGHLEGVYEIANLFITKDATYHALDRQGMDVRSPNAGKSGTYKRTPLVVLVDQYTMSSAETLAAVLGQRDRALVMGTRTGGKGMGQVRMNLPGNHALLVSIFRIQSSRGYALQGYGYWPHVEAKLCNADNPIESALQQYLWLDERAAMQAPLETACLNDDEDDDPLLEMAVQTLLAWNRQKHLTLLEAFRLLEYDTCACE